MISIVKPTKGGPEYVERAVRSVMAQTYQNWELLVLDASEEPTVFDLVTRIGKGDPRVLIFRFPSHRDPADRRSYGAGISHAELMAFLDSDDWWEPERLEIHVYV